MLFVATVQNTRAQCAKRSLKANLGRVTLLSHSDNLYAFRAVVRLYHLTPEYALTGWLLQNLCRVGHLVSLCWFVRAFNITPAYARANRNYALRAACENGHLAVAQWLTARFDLEADDARASDNFALDMACENGHLAVARWLAEHFALTAEDARAHNNYALHRACENGHLATAQWLTAHFALTAKDTHVDTNCMPRNIRKYPHVLAWLRDEFGID